MLTIIQDFWNVTPYRLININSQFVFASLHGVTEDFTLRISYRRFKGRSSIVTKISYYFLFL